MANEIDPAQRFHEAARLAGRLAHDFDNVLTGILGFAELAQSRLSADAPARDLLSRLIRVARDGVAASARWHEFNQCGVRSPGPTDLRQTWMQLSDKLRRGGTDYRFEEERPSAPVLVAIGAEPLKTVLINLVHNAQEANPGGPMRIRSEIIRTDSKIEAIRPAALPAGVYATWSVTDSGPGISEQLLGRLDAELIVTTKPRHRGIGLALVQRILAVHGGGIGFERATPHGWRSIVYLPTSPDATEAQEHGRSN